MTRAAALLVPILLLATAATRDRGPGIVGTPTPGGWSYTAQDFDAVALGGPSSASVHAGGGFSVHAHGPAEAIALLRVVRKEGRLEIGPRYEGDSRNDLLGRVSFDITMPAIRGAVLGGSGHMTVDRVKAPAFEGTLGGSGTLAIGALEADRATLTLGGSGELSARGHVRSLDVTIGGSGRVAAPALRADSAKATIAGSGGLRASVAGSAAVSMVGSGSVDLGPASHCTVSRLGHGVVTCGH